MAYTKSFLCIGAMVMLAACGDDGSSTNAVLVDASFDVSGSDVVVATKDDLPKCTDKRDGAVAFVKDEKVAYICDDGRWILDDDGELSSSSGKAKSSSSSGKAKSSSSSKGTSSAKETSSSSSENGPVSSANDTIPEAKIKNKTIYGVAQKGPFRAGAKVKIYELDGKTFDRTGNHFDGKIKSEGNGSFVVSGVTLSSPYALFEVTGRFRNEVTNQFSSNDVTLNALVDLSDRDTVNVNVLTHMEYKRVIHLLESGFSFSAAKTRAEADVFGAFGIEGAFDNSENLKIVGQTDGNAALLAVSVLTLFYGDESKLGEFLNDFSADIEKDGVWDDEIAKAKIADVAQDKFFKGELSAIYENIVGWNIGSISDKQAYKNYIAEYWPMVYGFGPCNSGVRVDYGAFSNKNSSLYGTGITFSCSGGIWLKRKIEGGDRVCALENEGIVVSVGNKSWRKCENGLMVNATIDDANKHGWDKGYDGEYRNGNEDGSLYMYDEILDKWVGVDDEDSVLMLNGCTYRRTGEISKSPKDGAYYYCDRYASPVLWYDAGDEPYPGWRKAVDVDFVRRDEKCEAGDVGRTIDRADSVTGSFYCTVNGWVDLMDWSYDVPKEFRFNPDIDYGTMTDERDGKTYRTVEIGEQVWMAENLNYAGPNDDISRCYGDVPATCEAGGRIYSLSVADTVCPSGWHLPTNEEFEILLTTVGGKDNASNVLRSASGWKKEKVSSDAYGFSALPTGGALIESRYGPFFGYSGYEAYFFSSDGYVFSIDTWGKTSLSGKNGAVVNPNEALVSVRCLQDAE